METPRSAGKWRDNKRVQIDDGMGGRPRSQEKLFSPRLQLLPRGSFAQLRAEDFQEKRALFQETPKRGILLENAQLNQLLSRGGRVPKLMLHSDEQTLRIEPQSLRTEHGIRTLQSYQRREFESRSNAETPRGLWDESPSARKVYRSDHNVHALMKKSSQSSKPLTPEKMRVATSSKQIAFHHPVSRGGSPVDLHGKPKRPEFLASKPSLSGSQSLATLKKMNPALLQQIRGNPSWLDIKRTSIPTRERAQLHSLKGIYSPPNLAPIRQQQRPRKLPESRGSAHQQQPYFHARKDSEKNTPQASQQLIKPLSKTPSLSGIQPFSGNAPVNINIATSTPGNRININIINNVQQQLSPTRLHLPSMHSLQKSDTYSSLKTEGLEETKFDTLGSLLAKQRYVFSRGKVKSFARKKPSKDLLLGPETPKNEKVVLPEKPVPSAAPEASRKENLRIETSSTVDMKPQPPQAVRSPAAPSTLMSSKAKLKDSPLKEPAKVPGPGHHHSVSPSHSRQQIHDEENAELSDLGIPDLVAFYGIKTRTGYVPNKPHKVNQDSCFVLRNFGKVKNIWYFGVCDGHGINGHKASDHVKKNLPSNLEFLDSMLLNEFRKNKTNNNTGPGAGLVPNSPHAIAKKVLKANRRSQSLASFNKIFDRLTSNSTHIIERIKSFTGGVLPPPPDHGPSSTTYFVSQNASVKHKLIQEGYLKTDHDLADRSFDVNFSGSTVVTVLLAGRHLVCANLGDSRAIIAGKSPAGGWRVTALSRDHKPDEESESRRILAQNGRIEPFREFNGDPIGPQRVWLKTENIPGLAMSRSVGDKVAHSVGVSSDPEIMEYYVMDSDRIMVLASDGVWEFISNKEVIEMVAPYYERNSPSGACERVMREAVARWKKEDEVIDDITLVVVFFAQNHYKKN